MEPNNFLDSIIEHSPYSMWISDDKGTLIRPNQACRDLFRLKDDEVIGKYNMFQDNILEEQGFLPMVRRVFEKGETARFTFEYDSSRLKSLNLEERTSLALEVTISPVLDPRGRVSNAIIHHIDITERKRAEDLLRESENKYRSVFETTGTATLIVEEDATISLINAEFERLSGYSRAEIEGKKRWTDFVAKDDLKLMKQYHHARRDAPGSTPGNYEFRFLDRQGNVKNIFLTVGLLAGTRKTVASLLDITERKRTEEALRKSEKEYRSVIENIQDVFYRSSLTGRLVMGSPSGAEMFGYEAIEEMIGLPLESFWANPQERESLLAQMKEKGSVRDFEAVLRRKDGTTFHGSFTVHFYYDDRGNLLGTEGMIRDITERKRAAAGMREGEERLRLIAENARVVIWMMDLNLRYTFISPYIEHTLGYTPEEYVLQPLPEVLTPSSLKLCLQVFAAELESEKKPDRDLYRSRTLEVEHVHRDGRIIWAEIHMTFIRDGAGNALGILGITRDITERRQAEEALRKSEKQAQDLLQETAIMARIGRIISSSLNIDEVYERFAAEVKKLVPLDRISIHEVNISKGEAITVYTTGLKIPTREAGAVYPLAGSVAAELLRSRSSLLVQGEAMEEFARRAPSYLPSYQAGIRSLAAVPLVSQDRVVGTLLLASTRPDAYSEQNLKLVEKIGNQIAGAIANGQLFREYRRTWGDLHRSEERYRRLVENAPLGIISVDPKGAITHVNAQMAAMLGFPSAAATLGLSIYSFSPLMESGVSFKFRRCVESGEAGVFERAYRGKEGEETHLRYHFTPIRDSAEKITGAEAMVEDVTERKQLEDQLVQAQKMEAIGTLAGGIAHDFNNILAAIMGYAELAGLDIPEDSKAKYNLEQSLKASPRAKNLVQQILAFSRQGKQERKPLDIGPIIKEGLKLLRASLPSTIEIRPEIEKDLGSVIADPTQIHQVLMNLCTNAGHAMSEKGGVLGVSLGKMDMGAGTAAAAAGIAAGSYLRLRVSDTGHGIPPQILKRIFEPYFTTKISGKGTGLGLAVVHGIVKSCGGGITVCSEGGRGSTFEVYFPRSEAAKPSSGAEKTEPPLLGGQESILFVDDEMMIAEIGQKLLRHLGYRVVVRTSSLEALELFKMKADEFDLVITDMTMPNMTGEELAREILEIRPGIPIVLCTGFSENMSEEKAKAQGIREFVLKPLVIMDLAKALRRALDSRERKTA